MIKLNNHPLLITTKYETSSNKQMKLLISGSGVRISNSVKKIHFPDHKSNLFYQFIKIKEDLYLLLSNKIKPNFYTATNINNCGYILGNSNVRKLLYKSVPHFYVLEFEKTDNKDILAFKLIK